MSRKTVSKYDLSLKIIINLQSLEKSEQHSFVWVWPNKAWFTITILGKNEVQIQIYKAFFTRWVNNKLQSFLLHIFYHIPKYTIMHDLTRHFEIKVAEALGKNLRPPTRKRRMTHVSKKCKSRRQQPHFLCPFQLTLWIRIFSPT